MLVILRVSPSIATCNLLIVTCAVEFFEDCVAEANYEAQKLDIMRDAVRARVSYSRARDNSVADQDETNNQ